MRPPPGSRDTPLVRPHALALQVSGPSTSHQLLFQGAVFPPDKPLWADATHLTVSWADVAKEGFPGWPAGARPWMGPPASEAVGSCLGPSSLLSPACGDSPLAPRNVVIFGPSVTKTVPRVPAKSADKDLRGPQ